ncbi:MAG: enoyl-CoA hydratase-related protein [Bryobacter sp.]|jgi:enoyl-CoA hydratase|nr:enoyl-CoA hydratase-related protein [Bryobacter sp.]
MEFAYLKLKPAESGILEVTIQRPEKLNALSNAVMAELSALLDGPAREARGLILTGAGEKAFVAGADIGDFAGRPPAEGAAFARGGQLIFEKLERLGRPSVAAINGYALGGGLELAMSCTVRIASPNAKLGLPECKLGILPGNGGTQRLPRLVGVGHALEMMLTGEPIDAAEAHRIGLVNKVVPAEELLPAAHALLGKMIANAPLALARIMECVYTGGYEYEAAQFGVLMGSEDAKEGTRAFLEKRKAQWQGR